MRAYPLFLLGLLACEGPTKDTPKESTSTDSTVTAGDEDGDGYAGDTDCNDGDAAIHPGAEERCDGVDNDCSGTVDDNPTDGSKWYADTDGDGYGNAAFEIIACNQPDGNVADATDCDDAQADVHPGAEETCSDTTDKNCDGSVGLTDGDQDGYTACEECDDTDAAIHPGAPEVCNGKDDDCDRFTDEDAADATSWYADKDGDLYGDAGSPTRNCNQPPGTVADATDCNDGDATIHPGATETCDGTTDLNCDGSVGRTDADHDGYAACEECNDADPNSFPGAAESCDGYDNNCDGTIDEGVGSNWYADTDGDGYGDPTAVTVACSAPSGSIADGSDCNDGDATVHPGAAEACTDLTDLNCDGSVGYTDADGDGYAACEECDDGAAAVYPGAVEVCNGGDDDCDGVTDGASAVGATLWYADADGDTYGNASVTVSDCSAPIGYVGDGTDCDDTDGAIHPNATELCTDLSDMNCDGSIGYTDADADGYAACEECNDTDADVNPGMVEVCNGKDDDCDGVADGEKATDIQLWYADFDGDGRGNAATSQLSCSQPSSYVSDSTDCDDTDALRYPGAAETCTDVVDYNCDGSIGNVDKDGDGYAACVECDDNAADVHPGAIEICNGSDDDCNGTADDNAQNATSWYADADGDGYGAPSSTLSACDQPTGYAATDDDCNDGDTLYHPGATETCTDTVDFNCDGSIGANDADGDGYYACQECDDGNAAVNPGATEVCNGLDDDCDGTADGSGASGALPWFRDRDGDNYGDSTTSVVSCDQPAGYVSDGSDCDDGNTLTHPNATESCTDRVDYNCDGSIGYTDGDGDGYAACQECDDGNAAVHPGVSETCNNLDDDCNGTVDDGLSTNWYRDADGDRYGDRSSPTLACAQPSGYVADNNDCDDLNSARNPGAAEVCDPNNTDEDCDTFADDQDPSATGKSSFYMDNDRDTYGDSGTAQSACDQPGGTAVVGGDCNDTSAAINPGAQEVCDAGNVDEDCDGFTDDLDPSVTGKLSWYQDNDKDSYGNPSANLAACDKPNGYVSDNTDCDDTSAARSPGQIEVCDGNNVDEDCDGLVNDADPSVTGKSTWYQDGDNDNYGSTVTTTACSKPAGYTSLANDCNDGNAAINPGATEVCDANNVDENCNGLADDNDTSVSVSSQTSWYADNDQDTFGNPGNMRQACDQPNGYVADNRDCNDSNSAIKPSATEVCDAANTDENCNGFADDQDSGATGQTPWYQDSDQDSYGNPSVSKAACDQPGGYVASNTDCNDGNLAINPGATEVCDAGNTDENCNGFADDADTTVSAATRTTWYQDLDKDTYGNPGAVQVLCDQPGGYVTDNTDCNDTNSSVRPNAQEICDGGNVDEDCDKLADDADPSATGQTPWYQDADSDLYGNPSVNRVACDQPSGFVADNTDCNDGVSSINPKAQEVCDAGNTDEDCDGFADDQDPSVSAGTKLKWFVDADGDTYGGAASTSACDQPSGYSSNNNDCNDGNSAINPGAPEVCDGGDLTDTDENCNGLADDADATVNAASYIYFYFDADKDNYGDPNISDLNCNTPFGYTKDNTDCNDTNIAINPGAREVCDAANVDEDCDNVSDDADPSVDAGTYLAWYADADKDGYGSNGSAYYYCDQPSGYISNNTDCDDTNAARNPGASEVCDASNVDEDCDKLADDADPSATGKTTWYVDADSDGYGTSTVLGTYCDAPSGGASTTTDCDDTHATVNPGMTEICEDYLNNDCGSKDTCRFESLAFDTAATTTFTGNTLGTSGFGFLGGNIAPSVAGGADVNNDGYADIAIADSSYDTAASPDNKGRVFVFRGSASGVTDTMSSPFATITGVDSGANLGAGVTFISDLNADGYDELLVGAYKTNMTVTDNGAAFLFLGKNLTAGAALTGSNATVTVKGDSAYDYFGFAVSDGGDLTGDGYNDYVAAGYSPTSSGARIGVISVVSGKLAAGTYTATAAAATAATPGAKITGVAADDRLGASVLGNIDMDGDGYNELYILSAKSSNIARFEAPLSGTYNSINASQNISSVPIQSSATTYEINCNPCMANAQDNNNDGYDDMFVSADDYDAGATTNVGAAYLLLGTSTVSSASLASLSTAQIYGYAASDNLGRAVSAGYINGDNYSDLLVGASGFDGLYTNAGGAAVIYGPASGAYNITATTVPANTAAYIGTITSGSLGASVSVVGDVDGDLFGDFLLGAPNDTNGGTFKYGKAFLFYGTGE